MPLRNVCGNCMRIRLIASLGLILAVSAARAFADAPELTDRIGAIVGDTPITQQEVEHLVDADERALLDRYMGQPDVLSKKLASLEESGTEILIQREAILQDFKKNIKVPDSIIEEYVQERIKQRFNGNNVELTKQLQIEGLTREQFKKRIRDQFIVDAMREKFITEPIISPKKVEDFYLVHRNDFKVEDQVKMRMIVLARNTGDTDEIVERTRRRAAEILLQLKGGATFADLARTYSEGSTAKDGGDTGWEDVSIVNKSLAVELEKLKPGQYSGVIETPTAFYLVMLEDRHPAHFKPLSEVREEIEHKLDAEERDRLGKKWIDRLKEKTFIVKF